MDLQFEKKIKAVFTGKGLEIKLSFILDQGKMQLLFLLCHDRLDRLFITSRNITFSLQVASSLTHFLASLNSLDVPSCVTPSLGAVTILTVSNFFITSNPNQL